MQFIDVADFIDPVLKPFPVKQVSGRTDIPIGQDSKRTSGHRIPGRAGNMKQGGKQRICQRLNLLILDKADQDFL